LNQFNTDNIDSQRSINFEKSATYFDSILAIKRIKALLPHVRLIMMFTEPGTRAYSRYQVRSFRKYQMKYHNIFYFSMKLHELIKQ
jgi:hypothetical protein